MAPLAPADENRLVEAIHQSGPVDTTAPYSPSTLRGKTILLTGGSTGLGAAFARHWAAHGANLIIGDINADAGLATVAELRSLAAAAGHPQAARHHHFVQCDVTSWPSQARLFQEAVRLSPTGELDAVVASAGVSDRHGATTGRGFESPAGLDRPDPPAPDLGCVQVNLIGMMYTAHLALFWLQRDADAAGAGAGAGDDGSYRDERDARDRHFLIVGSSAGLYPLPGVPEYVTSKHGVAGLFRALRTLSGVRQGVRVNMLCPYFVDTPILPNRAVAMLAGLGLARLDDTVDAATRLMAATTSPPAAAAGDDDDDDHHHHHHHRDDSIAGRRIAGRALMVGPRLPLLKRVLPDRELSYADVEVQDRADAAGGHGGDDLSGEVVDDRDVALGRGQAVWEMYAHDYDTVDFFIRRYLRLLNTIAKIKGWIGFWRELWHALFVRKEPKSARARV